MGDKVLWFVGDNFMAKSFRVHYRNKTGEFYIKNRFDYSAFCNSKYASPQENMLGRIQNAVASSLNASPKSSRLPQYIIMVLDDDLITYLDCNHAGVTTLLGTWIQWIVDEINMLLEARIKQLPDRCNKQVFVYWVSAPMHSDFTKDRNNLRMK